MNIPWRSIVVMLLAGWLVTPARAADVVPVVRCTIQFPEAAVTPERNVYIPFRQVGQLMAVEVRVDTVTGLFIVDTGSEHLVLNQHHFPAFSGGRPVASVGNTGLVGQVRERDVD